MADPVWLRFLLTLTNSVVCAKFGSRGSWRHDHEGTA